MTLFKGDRMYFTDAEGQYLYFLFNNGIVSYYDEPVRQLDGLYFKKDAEILKDLTQSNS